MNLAIICANIGSIDAVHGLPRQNIPYTYHYYTESNLPFPLPNLNARMRSKYIKIMMHRFLPQYDAYIWIDGKVQVLTNNFAEMMVNELGSNDIGIMYHADRKTPHEEISFIEHHMEQGNQYLLSRYGNQQIHRERELFDSEYDYDLFETTLFIRRNNKKVNNVFEMWWNWCIEYSYFDQVVFSRIANFLNVSELPRESFADIFKITKHL